MRENPRSFEDDTPTVELPAVTAPLPPVQPFPAQQQRVPAQPPTTRVQPRVSSWATPTEVDAVAIPVSEGRAPGPPGESDKERRRREMNEYRLAVWERRFVACVRWLYSRARTAVYITAVVVLPGLLLPPIRGYLNWVMVANLALVGFVAVSLVAGEVTSRRPQWSCMLGALFRLLLVGGFAIACGYVSEADPWKETLAGAPKSWNPGRGGTHPPGGHITFRSQTRLEPEGLLHRSGSAQTTGMGGCPRHLRLPPGDAPFLPGAFLGAAQQCLHHCPDFPDRLGVTGHRVRTRTAAMALATASRLPSLRAATHIRPFSVP